MTRLLCMLFIFSMVGSVWGQTKYEKEVRIKEESVPENALEFIQGLNFDRKIRWYKEFGLETTTIEAKTKFNGKRYSIEFSKDGELEDVEVGMKWNELSNEVRSKIDDYLVSKYKKYSVDKLQIQYTGDPETVANFVRSGSNASEVTIKYELVLHTRVDKKYTVFEYLFSAEGDFLQSAEVIQKNSDNIEY